MCFRRKKKEEKKQEVKDETTTQKVAKSKTEKKVSVKKVEKRPVPKATSKNKIEKRQVKKETAKIALKEAKVGKETAAKAKTGEEKQARKGVYRVVYDKEDSLWKIKKDGASRVIDSRKTKEEALARVQELSKNKNIKFVVHKKDGKMQKKSNLKLKKEEK